MARKEKLSILTKLIIRDSMLTFYPNINDFYLDNENNISENNLRIIQNLGFYKEDILLSTTDFSLKLTLDNKDIFAVSKKNKGVFIFGAIGLAEELADEFISHGLIIEKITATPTILFKFARVYNDFFENEIDMDSTIDITNYDILLQTVKFTKSGIKKFLVAGGCFWCMAKPYNDYEGVNKVISGFAGGNDLAPTYLKVKEQTTGHKESILVYYEEEYIKFSNLLKIYFESIDPFDSDGQFIDKGSNYQTAVFTSTATQITTFKKMIKAIETEYGKPVAVKLLPDMIFFPAEEEHQDYASKNPEAFKEEENKSGRNDFEYIKIK